MNIRDDCAQGLPTSPEPNPVGVNGQANGRPHARPKLLWAVPEPDDVEAMRECGRDACHIADVGVQFDGRDIAILAPRADGYALGNAPDDAAFYLRNGARSVKIVSPEPIVYKRDDTLRSWLRDWLPDVLEVLYEEAEPFRAPEPPPARPDSVESVDSVALPGEEIIPPLRLGMLPPAGVFPLDVLPEPCVVLARAVARAVGCDVASIAGSMLAMAGGLMGQTVHLKLRENWIVPPIIFHANVADPGQGKTWGQRYLTEGTIDEIEDELQAEFDAEKRAYRELCKADKKTEHDRPVPQQLLVDDSTIEALFIALSHNPRGLLATLDELTVLFAGLNQYKGGKGADRSHFLKIWTGSRVTINRAKNEFGEPLRIPFPHLSITGNIPPDNLHLIRGPHGNDGMLERWLYTFAEWHKKLKASERGSVPESALKSWNKLIRSLWDQQMERGSDGEHPRLVGFDRGGRVEFFSRYDAHVDEFNDESFPHSLRGAWSKLEVYAGRLALVLHGLHWAANGGGILPPVGSSVADGAWKLVDYFKGEHKRVRAALEQQGGEMPEGARLHLNWIRNHRDATAFSERDIKLSYPPSRGYTDAMMADGRTWLRERNAILLRPSTVRPEGTPGNKPSPVWGIHPDLRAQQNQQIQRNPDPEETTA
jgi:hypothetical protein